MAGTPYVAIVGPGIDATERECELARAIGKELALAGCVVVNGGLAGVMQAASLGARDGGGVSIGVLPGASVNDAPIGQGLVIATGMGEARNLIVVSTARVVVSVGCSWGTLSEIALAMRASKPVVQLDGWLQPSEGLSVLSSDGASIDVTAETVSALVLSLLVGA